MNKVRTVHTQPCLMWEENVINIYYFPATATCFETKTGKKERKQTMIWNFLFHGEWKRRVRFAIVMFHFYLFFVLLYFSHSFVGLASDGTNRINFALNRNEWYVQAEWIQENCIFIHDAKFEVSEIGFSFYAAVIFHRSLQELRATDVVAVMVDHCMK